MTSTASSEYPTIPVDWTLACDFHGLVDDADVDGDDGMDAPELAWGSAVRPDAREVRVHIEGDDPTWLALGEVPVYLVRCNPGCAAKGRAIFDRLFAAFGAPRDVLGELPDSGEPWRDETATATAAAAGGAGGVEEEDGDGDGDAAAPATAQSKTLDAAKAPVQAVDAPGTLVFKVMSMIRGGAGASSTIPRQRDSSQSFRLEGRLLTGASASSADDAVVVTDLSWKIKSSVKFHWSTKQRSLPLLDIAVVEKRSTATAEDVGEGDAAAAPTTPRLRALVQLAPLVIHPGQVVDSWFPCTTTAADAESNRSGLGTSRDPVSIRVVAQYVPDVVPERKKRRGASKLPAKSNTISAAKAKSSSGGIPWGAGANRKKRKGAKGRTSQVVLRRDAGLSGTLATASDFDGQQLSLISELGQILRGAKLHLKIVGCRKVSYGDVAARKNAKLTVGVFLGGSLATATRSPVQKGTTGPCAVDAPWNKEFLVRMSQADAAPLGTAAGNSPVIALQFTNEALGKEAGTVHVPLLSFVVGQGHISDAWYPIYGTSSTLGQKIGEVRLIMQVHSLVKIKPRALGNGARSLGQSSSGRLPLGADTETNSTLMPSGPPVVTERTLIITVKKAMGVVLGSTASKRVIAPKVTVTLCTASGGKMAASTAPLEYLAPATGGASTGPPDSTSIQELDSHVDDSGVLEAAWREDLFIDIPTVTAMGKAGGGGGGDKLGGLSGAVLRFDLADANAVPPYARTTNAGRNAAMIFATGSQDISDALAQSLATPAGPSEEIWVTLNTGGQLLCSVKRGPLPPPSPKLKASPRRARTQSSQFKSAVAAGTTLEKLDGLAGVLHLHVSDLKGVSPEATSAFIRARAVVGASGGTSGNITHRARRGAIGIGLSGAADGTFVYGLAPSMNSVSTAAAMRNSAGIMVWDEPLTLKVPVSKAGGYGSEEEEGADSSSNNDGESGGASDKWQDNSLVVISVYAASIGSSVYELVAEVQTSVRACLAAGDQLSLLAKPITRGRTMFDQARLQFRASLSKISDAPGNGAFVSPAGSALSDASADDSKDNKDEIAQLNAVADLKKTFYALDRDRSGTVSSNELVEFLMENQRTAEFLAKNDLQLSLSADSEENRRRLLNLFRRMDHDGNGEVTWEEFIAYVQGLHRLASSGAVQSGGNDVLSSSNMPDWAVTQQDGDNSTSENTVPLLSLNQSNGGTGMPIKSSAPRLVKKAKSRNKKKQKADGSRSPSVVNLAGRDGRGPPQHELMFEDSFRWNRKNFDLPKRLTAAEKAAKREEKARKRKEATAIAPADRAEALEQQVAQLRQVVKQKDEDTKRKMAATMRSVALMTKRAREAEGLLKTTTSGQASIQPMASNARRSGENDDEGGASRRADSEVVLELNFRCKQLAKENKELKTRLREAETRELDLLDERADGRAGLGSSGLSRSDAGSGAVSPANTSRSTRSIKGRGKAAVRMEEMRLEVDRLQRELDVAREKSDSAAATFEHKLSSRDTDIRLLRKEVERLKGSLTVEREVRVVVVVGIVSCFLLLLVLLLLLC